MTAYYPIVIETETSGAVSAYVPGLPVYAAADSRAKVERAVRRTLAAYLDAHPMTSPTTRIRVARVSDNQKSKINGRLGGRPPRRGRKPTKAARRA